ncbi:STAS domain-containing protein [Streptomyces sp. NPDC051920]|uniref:STAS domain-containing protein n=1 Tax=Streptomyces sp. NPDC051920 TaxID=3155523 RepID=UPI00342806A3
MRITTTVNGTTARITPRGPIDYATLPDLRAALAALPDAVTDVLWDVQDVSFMDVAGLHLLFDQPLQDGHRPQTIGVTGLAPQPLRLLTVAAQVFPTLDVAGVVCDGFLGQAA